MSELRFFFLLFLVADYLRDKGLARLQVIRQRFLINEFVNHFVSPLFPSFA
jgi:hypothetical protein